MSDDESTAQAGDVWQEADGVLLLCVVPGAMWGDFNGHRFAWDATTIARPLRRLLDPEGNLVDAEQAVLAATVARVEALADLYDSWEGEPDHPGASSPRQRAQLRAALRGPDVGDAKLRPPNEDEAANWCYGQVVGGKFAIVGGELLVVEEEEEEDRG